MDLVQRFGNVECEQSISVGELDINKLYTIMKAQRNNTKYDPSILISISDDSDRWMREFIPKRYRSVFTDIDIERIIDVEISK